MLCEVLPKGFCCFCFFVFLRINEVLKRLYFIITDDVPFFVFKFWIREFVNVYLCNPNNNKKLSICWMQLQFVDVISYFFFPLTFSSRQFFYGIFFLFISLSKHRIKNNVEIWLFIHSLWFLNYHNFYFYSDFLLIFIFNFFSLKNFSETSLHWISYELIYAFTSQPQPSLLLWCNWIILCFNILATVKFHYIAMDNRMIFYFILILTFNESEEKKQNTKWKTFIIFKTDRDSFLAIRSLQMPLQY